MTSEVADELRDIGLERLLHVERNFGAPQLSMKTVYDNKGNCRYIALKGETGREVSCSIYDVRPQACRSFEPRSDVCDYARQIMFGISYKQRSNQRRDQ